MTERPYTPLILPFIRCCRGYYYYFLFCNATRVTVIYFEEAFDAACPFCESVRARRSYQFIIQF